jgi:hypothetical protein
VVTVGVVVVVVTKMILYCTAKQNELVRSAVVDAKCDRTTSAATLYVCTTTSVREQINCNTRIGLKIFEIFLRDDKGLARSLFASFYCTREGVGLSKRSPRLTTD